jgi:hypothetical protein
MGWFELCSRQQSITVHLSAHALFIELPDTLLYDTLLCGVIIALTGGQLTTTNSAFKSHIRVKNKNRTQSSKSEGHYANTYVLASSKQLWPKGKGDFKLATQASKAERNLKPKTREPETYRSLESTT